MTTNKIIWISITIVVFVVGFLCGFQYAENIPAVILAAVLAAILTAVLTLCGVIISNNNTRKMHLDKLEHETKQRNRDREMGLRKECYIEAVAAVGNIISLITSVSNLNVSDNDIVEAMNINRSILSKVSVVANNETVESIVDISNEVATVMLRLLIKRYELQQLKIKIDINQKAIDKYLADMNETVSKMQKYNEELTNNPAIFSRYSTNYDFAQKEFEKYSQANKDMNIKLVDKQAELSKVTFSEFKRISMLLPRVIFSIRDELELPLNKEKFIENHKSSLEKGTKEFIAFLDEAKEMLRNI